MVANFTKKVLKKEDYLNLYKYFETLLKIDDIKYIKKEYDEKKELNELIKLKTNQQLNQQSIIYFNKIKKNTTINEL